jgi:hypothetical protein
VDVYHYIAGPETIGISGVIDPPHSGSGDLVGIFMNSTFDQLYVPSGYVSGSALSGTSTYDNTTFSGLGVTPGTYEWTWGPAADDSFTVQIGPAAVPAPLIGRGLPVLLAVSGLLFGAKLLQRGKRRRLRLG